MSQYNFTIQVFYHCKGLKPDLLLVFVKKNNNKLDHSAWFCCILFVVLGVQRSVS